LLPARHGRTSESEGRSIARSDDTDRGLGDSAARYRSLFTNAPVGLFRTSMDGRILEANRAWLDMLGYPDVEALQDLTGEALYVDPAVHRQYLYRLEREGAATNVECALRRRDGVVIWVLASTRLVRADDGTPAYLEGAMVDITGQAGRGVHLRATRFEALNAIVASAVAATDLEALFEAALETTISTIGADAGAIWVGETIVLKGISRDACTNLAKGRQATNVDLRALRAVDDWLDHAPANTGPLAAAIRQTGFRAAIRAPVVAAGGVIGGIAVFSTSPRAWARDDLVLLETIGKQIGVAAQRLQLAAATRQRTAELEAFYDLSRRLREARSEQEMYPIVVDHARQLLGADMGALAFAAPDHEKFTVAYSVGIEREGPGHVFGAHHTRSGLVLRTGNTFVTPDFSAQASPGPGGGPPYHLAGPLVIVPVRSEDEVIGTLRMARWKRPDARPFSDAEVRLLEVLAEMAGTAIRRAHLHNDLEHAYIEMMLALARTVDARDSYTSDHSEQIATRAVRLARALGCTESEVQDIYRAGLLHDIGKLAVPDHILRKPGALDAAEWRVIRQHPIVGAEILRPVDRLGRVAPLVRHHQEWWDGAGYPDGLRGEAIPLGARILAVVDAYSAILDDRAYSPARTPAEALEELRRCAGTQFDPQVVETFCQVAMTHEVEPWWQGVKTAPPGSAVTSPAASIGQSLSSAWRAGRAMPAMTELAKRLLRPLDLATVLDEVLRQIQEVFGYPTCGVFFIDEPAQELYMVAQRGLDPSVAQMRLAVGKRGVIGWVAGHRHPYYAPDVTQDPHYVAASPATRSEAAFPLIVDDRIIGVVDVESPEVNAFSKESRDMLEAFAVIAGLAILRAQRDGELNRLALTDGLTGLANRRALWDALHREIARARRQNRPVSVLVIEIDRFKVCNDRLGHLEGDHILQTVAAVLQANTRGMDLVARFGGDEFVVLLPDAGAAIACQVAERVRAQVEGLRFLRTTQVTVSLGQASMPEDGATAESLIEMADQRMYEAKRRGGNQVGAA